MDWDSFGQQKNCFKVSLNKLFEVVSAPKYCEMLVRRGLTLSPTEFGKRHVYKYKYIFMVCLLKLVLYHVNNSTKVCQPQYLHPTSLVFFFSLIYKYIEWKASRELTYFVKKLPILLHFSTVVDKIL